VPEPERDGITFSIHLLDQRIELLDPQKNMARKEVKADRQTKMRLSQHDLTIGNA
jgi:hypothetical protein